MTSPIFEQTKKYHFYAAHRNELLKDKCSSLHGHTYHVDVTFLFKQKDNGITMLFSDVDAIVEPIIKSFDHACLMHENDPLLPYLQKYSQDTGDQMKLVVINDATSLENLTVLIAGMIKKRIPELIRVSVRETESSIISINL